MSVRIVAGILSLAWICQPLAYCQTAGSGAQQTVQGTDDQAGSAGTIALNEKLDSFDERAVELRWGQGGWQLWAGTVFLKDFGKKEQDARNVLNVMRELHLDTRGRLGAPQAVAEYWLSGGQPPRAAPQGAHTLAFDASSLSVVQVEGQWMLRERRRALLSFGANEAEARRALAVFEHYHFDRFGYIGEPTPCFMYFLSSSDQLHKGEISSEPSRLPDSFAKTAKPIHVVTTGAKPLDSKHGEIDPKVSSQLLPPGRQLIRVSDIPGQASVPDQVPFNWQGARLHQVGDNWELVAQDVTIARFGLDEASAKEALALLRHYHFTQLCLVGGAEPCFSYLLVNGRLPRELRFGVGNIAFHAERVQVNHRGSAFVVEQDETCIHNFGPREDAARSLCEFIRQSNPDHLCWVGPDPDHGMVFFVRSTLAPFNSGNDLPRKP